MAVEDRVAFALIYLPDVKVELCILLYWFLYFVTESLGLLRKVLFI